MADLDMTKVEVLRKHMLLTKANVAELIGVSRVTYYGWAKGKPIRRSNVANAKATVKRLLSIVMDHQWPTPEVRSMTQEQRFARLIELLQDHD